MNKTSVPVEQQYYFNAVVEDPLIFKLQTLRDESAYDTDPNAEITALKYIEKVSKRFKGHIYLISVGSDIAPSSYLRMKKSALWGESELRGLHNRSFEVFVDNINTRLVSIVDLEQYSYDKPSSRVLNWITSMMLLSTLDLDELINYVSSWINSERKSIIPYNYDAISKTLPGLNTTAVLRYFPADNGKHESLVTVGEKDFVINAVIPCFKEINQPRS